MPLFRLELFLTISIMGEECGDMPCFKYQNGPTFAIHYVSLVYLLLEHKKGLMKKI